MDANALAAHDAAGIERALTRSLIPEVVFSEDLGAIFPHLSPIRLCRHLLEGRFGSVLHVGGRPAVLRADLIDSLRRCASPGGRGAHDVLGVGDDEEAE